MPENKRDAGQYYLSYYRKLYECWESSMSRALTLWFQNPLFSNSLVNATEKTVELRKYMFEIMDRTMKRRKVPAKGDMDEMAGQLEALEEKVNDLSEMMGKMEGAASKKPHSKRKA